MQEAALGREGTQRSPSASAPKATIVVICYNDSERLPKAVSSALGQTYPDLEVLIVDDHSSDSTPDVAARLAKHNRRVRYSRLSTNSGGCGAPRNAGIEQARGSYIMFLDSDDELTPNALASLIAEAEASKAEIIVGGLERHHTATGRVEPWYQWIYNRARRMPDLSHAPELVHDTVATNKLYRASIFHRTGIRFPVGVLYEDIIFTSKIWVAARGIAVITEVVYWWKVYPPAERLTITNRRAEERNFSDRIEAVLAVRHAYQSQALAVRVEADVKALQHHLMLHLKDLSLMAPESADRFLRESVPVVAGAEHDALARLRVPERVMYALVCAGNVDALLAVISARELGLLPGKLVTRVSGEKRWQLPTQILPSETLAAHNQFAVIPELLDLTGMTPSEEYLSDTQPRATLTEARPHTTGLTLFGAVARESSEALTMPDFAIVQRGSSAELGSQVYVDSEAAFGWIWRAELPELRRTPRDRDPGSSLLLTRVSTDPTHDQQLPLHTLPSVRFSVPVRQGGGRLLGDRWTAEPQETGPLHLGIRTTTRGRIVRGALNLLKRIVPGR